MTICSVLGCQVPARARGYCKAHYSRWQRYGAPTAGRTGKGEARAWLERSFLIETDKCIEWPFATSDGYGCIKSEGRQTTPSRVVCEMAQGEPPSPTSEAAHLCGNSKCCNKRHVRWATRTQNEADKIEHGTVLLGERANSSKLTSHQVLAIRAARDEGVPTAAIARVHGVNETTIRRILAGRSWRWLGDQNMRDHKHETDQKRARESVGANNA